MAHLHSLNCIPAAVRNNRRYAGDHVIRHYRSLGLAELLADLGLPPQESYTVTGGIGTLTMFADGSERWDTTATAKPVTPIPTDPALEDARKAACAACPSFTDSKCGASGCGCAGEGKPSVLSSICPLGRWPSLTSLTS